MATGALDANGIWQYGEDDSNTTFSALLNRLASSTSTQIASAKPSGRVLQTVSTTKTDLFTTTSATLVDVTGLSVTITPRSSTSKFLVFYSVAHGATASGNHIIQLVRNTTQIAKGTGGTNNATFANDIFNVTNAYAMINVAGHTLDSPATTSAVTYKIQISSNGGTMTVNRRGTDTNFTAVSDITVLEIAA